MTSSIERDSDRFLKVYMFVNHDHINIPADTNSHDLKFEF